MTEVRTEPLPSLSVVVPVYNVEDYVEEALRSVLGQPGLDLQVIVVDDGSTDGSSQIVARIAAEDPRVQVVTQKNAGLGAARNSGLPFVTGDYLVFFDSDDVVEPGSYGRIVRVLEETGSDFAVAPYEILRDGKLQPPGEWIRTAHSVERRVTNLLAFPQIQVNVVAWSKIYRTAFFRASGLRYPENVYFEDQEPATLSYALATRFDVIQEPVVQWRIRERKTSITQQSHDVRNLEDRVSVTLGALQILDRMGYPAARRERGLQLLSTGTFTLAHLRDGDRRYWDVVAAAVRTLLPLFSRDELVHRVTVQDRVLFQLLQDDKQEEAIDFIEAGGRNIAEWVVSEDSDGLLYGDLPGWPKLRALVPRWVLRVTAQQLPPQTFVEAWSWAEDSSEVTVDGYAYFASLDGESETTMRLVDKEAHVVLGVASTRAPSPLAESLTRHRYLGYGHCGFRGRIDTAALARLRRETGVAELDLTVELTVRASGLVQTCGVRNTQASRARLPRIRRVVDGSAIDVRFDVARGLVVRVSAAVPLVLQEIGGGPDRLELRWQDDAGFTAVQADLPAGRKPLVALEGTGPGHAAVPLPGPSAPATDDFRIGLHDAAGRRRQLGLTPLTRIAPAVRERFWVVEAAGGQPTFMAVGAFARLCDVRCSGSTIEVVLDLGVAGPGEISAVLGSDREEMSCRASRREDGTAVLAFDATRAPRPGWSPELVARGRYELQVTVVDAEQPRPIDVVADPALDARLPLRQVGDGALRVSLRREPGMHVSFRIGVGGDDSVRLPAGKTALIGAYRDAPAEPLRRACYLQCLRGDQVNDTQLAMARYLEQAHPDIEVIWGVVDASIRVPAGHRRVIVDSPEYFDALATSAVLCFNHEVPVFLAARPGQLVVQTYHGHPFKMMGLGRFEALGYSPLRIERSLDWRRHWDILLSPSPIATTLYRDNFPVGAEIVEVGHPRNDRLANATDDERAVLRSSLGIPEGATAVLYAPTWRDYATNDPWASKMVTFFDPSELSAQLGDGFVVLLRGHPAHGRAQYSLADGDGVIDVTYQPDINDVIIASDVGVFDYSSIRFDYSVTGRPMVFFVPDRDEFFAAAPALLPFEETTPGPQVTRAEDLATTIRLVASDASAWNESYARFRKEFNPWDDGHAADRFVEQVISRSQVLSAKPTEAS